MTDFVIVWEDDKNDDDWYQIFGKGYDSNGKVSFSDIEINEISTKHQLKPQVAMNETGCFVVVWEDNKSGTYQIFMKGFNSKGEELFVQKRVNTEIVAHSARYPHIAMSRSGDFVVVWQDSRDADFINGREIYMKGYDINGVQNPDLPEQRISTRLMDVMGPLSERYTPRVAMAPGGDKFVVVWHDGVYRTTSLRPDNYWKDNFMRPDEHGVPHGGEGADDWDSELGQLVIKGFNADGSEIFDQKFVYDHSDVEPSNQYWPDIGMDEAGRFVVVWVSPLHYYGVFARSFDSTGSAISGRVTIKHTDRANFPKVTMNFVTGEYFVVWEDDADKNNTYQIRGRKLWLDGTYSGIEFTVNSKSRGNQFYPDLALNGISNDIAYVWQDDSDAPFGTFNIFARGKAATAGGKSFNDIPVNSNTRGQQLRPSIAYKPNYKINLNCFINIFSIGTPMIDDVNRIRTFRDEELRGHKIGENFMSHFSKIFDEISPKLISIGNETVFSKEFMKWFITYPSVKYFKLLQTYPTEKPDDLPEPWKSFISSLQVDLEDWMINIIDVIFEPTYFNLWKMITRWSEDTIKTEIDFLFSKILITKRLQQYFIDKIERNFSQTGLDGWDKLLEKLQKLNLSKGNHVI